MHSVDRIHLNLPSFTRAVRTSRLPTRTASA
ncbi:MAG: hypothetical protein JWP44_4203, partial [Mucilaginibacter sp.]|nr:hypothetical protein [Mucilaginibacter sp.]